MKNQKLLLIGFASLIAVFAIGVFLHAQAGVVPQYNEGNIGPSVEYVMETSFPKADSAFPVLTVNGPDVTSKSVTEIGTGLGFAGEAGPAGEGMIGMLNEDETEHLLVYEKSGGMFYSVLDKMNPVVTSQPDLPSDEEAVQIAQSFLAERNLLPPDAKLDKVVADTQIEAEKSTGKVLEEYRTVLQVMSSGRSVNGIPIVGPGNKLSVYVGEKGEVVGFLKVWRDVEVSKDTVNIKTAENAFEDMRKRNALFVTTDANTINKVNIKNVYIAYWMEPATEGQDSALPVYVFEGDSVNDHSQVSPFTAYVQATVDGTVL